MTAVRFLPAAELELLKEFSYYSKQRPETGLRFRSQVEAVLERAVHQPMGGTPLYRDIRGLVIKAFPLSIIYRSSKDEVLVVAISPHRKRPSYWASRID